MPRKFNIFQTKAQRYLQMFNAPQREALIDEYISSVGFGKDANFGENAFNSFLQNKIKGLDGFKDTKNEKDKVAFRPRILEDTTIQTTADLKESLATAFDPTGFDTAKANYNNSMENFKSLTEGRPPKYAPQTLVDHIKGIQQQAINEVEAQQAIEKSNLERLFTNDSFLNNLAATTPGVDQVVLKENMMDDLKETHKKQKDNLQKEFDKATTSLHDSNKVEREKWLFIAMLYDNNMMREEILAKAEQNAPNANTAISVGVNKTQISFANIDPHDLGIIKTITGKDIIPTADGKGFYIEFGIGDVVFRRGKGEADLKLLAFAMKAAGNDSVIYDVDINPNENPPTKALARARLLYAASIEAGFEKQKSPKDASDKSADRITFNINGKTMRVDEIFKGHEAQLNEIQARADVVKRQADAIAAKHRDGSTNAAQLKDELRTLRENANAAAPAAPLNPGAAAAAPVVANANAVAGNPVVANANAVAGNPADVPELPQELPEIDEPPPLPDSGPPVLEGKEEVPAENAKPEVPAPMSAVEEAENAKPEVPAPISAVGEEEDHQTRGLRGG